MPSAHLVSVFVRCVETRILFGLLREVDALVMGVVDSSVASMLLSLDLLLGYFTLFPDRGFSLYEIPILLKSLSLR